MIDLHSHILPCVDDGSQSVEESIELLRALAAQGVHTVCATPHFEATSDSPTRFLARRDRAYEQLASAVQGLSLPRVLLGAEVAYFSGIANSQVLQDLRLQQSSLLLVEMPMGVWSDYSVKELIQMACSSEVTPVLAHIERYLSFVNRRTLDELAQHGVLMQLNAPSFARWSLRGRMTRLIRDGYVQFIASDCHNMQSRPPRFDLARERIAGALGDAALSHMDRLAESYFSPQSQP